MDSASANLAIAVAAPVLLLFVAACCNWRCKLRHLLPVLFANLSDIVRRRRQLQHAAHATYSEIAPDAIRPHQLLIAAPGLYPSPSQHQNGAMMSVQETASSRLSSTECVTGQLPWLSACNGLEQDGAAGALLEAVRVESISKPLPVHETLSVEETNYDNGEP